MSRTPLVHVDQPLAGVGAGEVVALTDQEQHHLRSVLRLRVGDGVEVSDGDGGHGSGDLVEGGVRLRSGISSMPRPGPPMHVVHALPKGRKLDEVVRACVELGMDALLPVAADRSVRRPEGARADRAVVRWTAVARAACEQSRRTYRPSVSPIAAVTDLVVEHRWLIAHPEAAESLPEVLVEDAPSGHGAPVTIAIGPEGGWSDAEVDHLVSAGARGVRLGPTVLRTEHAAAAALAVMGAALGRWDQRAFPTP